MAAIDQIVGWASGLSPWLGDLVRRHLVNSSESELGEQDFKEVCDIAFHELKLTDVAPQAKPEFPALTMLSGTNPSTDAVALKSITNARFVNAIKDNETLPFAPKGVTVVYGKNGVGKSGYARILKLACRARDKKEAIIPNIYATTTQGTPSAKLVLDHNGSEVTVDWMQGGTSDDLLANIAVFDSRCARVIIDDRYEISYLPYGADVFEKVVASANRLKQEIDAKLKSVPAIVDSAIPEQTAAGAFLNGFNASIAMTDVDAACAWEKSHADDLAAAQELVRLSQAEVQAAELVRLGKVRDRITAASTLMASIAAQSAKYDANSVTSLLGAVEAASNANEIAVAERSAKEALPGVGSTNAWELLYNAAKDFSETTAYPGQQYPVITDGALCVLCNQELSVEAQQRFAKFKRFIEDKTADDLRRAKLALANARTAIAALTLLQDDNVAICSDDLKAFDVLAADALALFHATAKTWKDDALAVIDGKKSLPDWPAPLSAPTTQITTTVQAVDAKVAAIKSSSNPTELQTQGAKVAQLQARQALSLRKADVVALLLAMQHNQKIAAASASVRTNEITRQGTTLIKNSLTPALVSALQTELQRLGAGRIKLSMRASGAGGETTHEMKLDNVQLKAKISQVLSEGEQRVIAIAGFFAELGIASHGNPIVFDDPVSSLDHEFTRRIAQRIVEEGRNRQVIVFTHDIAFLMELADAADDLGKGATPVHVGVQTLRRTGEKAGISAEGLPWHAQKVNQRIPELEKLVKQKLEPLHSTDPERYNELASRIYGLLRETWEAFIEEVLFYDVVTRYRNSVKTLKLYEVTIEDEDVLLIDRHMSKCSTWMTGHDKSKGLDESRPAPAEIRDDIAALQKAVSGMKQRRQVAKQRREKLQTP